MQTTLDAYLHNKLNDPINGALQHKLNHNNFYIFPRILLIFMRRTEIEMEIT